MNVLSGTLAGMSDVGSGELIVAAEAWPPPGERWIVLNDIVEIPGVVDSLIQDLLAGEARGRRDVAGSYLASWISGTAAGIAAGALITMGRAWPLPPQGIALHRHADGWFDGMALKNSTVWILPDDPAAGSPDAVVFEDTKALGAALAAEVARVVEPVFAAVRTATRYPTRSMWGSLADGIAGTALWRGVRSGTADPALWDRAGAFLDRLEERTRLLRVRPNLAEIAWSGGVARLSVKGTCCLYFKTFEGVPDPCREGYCSSCPFRAPESRTEKWADWLEENAVAT